MSITQNKVGFTEQFNKFGRLDDLLAVNCKCKVRFDNDGLVRWEQCALHNAAPAMYEAGQAAVKLLISHWSEFGLRGDEQLILNNLKQALRQAEGGGMVQ